MFLIQDNQQFWEIIHLILTISNGRLCSLLNLSPVKAEDYHAFVNSSTKFQLARIAIYFDCYLSAFPKSCENSWSEKNLSQHVESCKKDLTAGYLLRDNPEIAMGI